MLLIICLNKDFDKKMRILYFITITFFLFSHLIDSSVLAKNNAKLKVLIAYHSKTENTKKLALAFAKGVKSASNANITYYRIPDNVSKLSNYLTKVQNLDKYDAIAFGSPVYFGGMSGQLKVFLDHSLDCLLYTSPSPRD